MRLPQGCGIANMPFHKFGKGRLKPVPGNVPFVKRRVGHILYMFAHEEM
jgi:hypothetical protein